MSNRRWRLQKYLTVTNVQNVPAYTYRMFVYFRSLLQRKSLIDPDLPPERRKSADQNLICRIYSVTNGGTTASDHCIVDYLPTDSSVHFQANISKNKVNWANMTSLNGKSFTILPLLAGSGN
jgi:hypothetical protein